MFSELWLRAQETENIDWVAFLGLLSSPVFAPQNRCLRRDKMTEAMQAFVVDVMGQFFVEPPTFNLKSCYEDSSVTMPLIFVLSTGSDPNKVPQANGYAPSRNEWGHATAPLPFLPPGTILCTLSNLKTNFRVEFFDLFALSAGKEAGYICVVEGVLDAWSRGGIISRRQGVLRSCTSPHWTNQARKCPTAYPFRG